MTHIKGHRCTIIALYAIIISLLVAKRKLDKHNTFSKILTLSSVSASIKIESILAEPIKVF